MSSHYNLNTFFTWSVLYVCVHPSNSFLDGLSFKTDGPVNTSTRHYVLLGDPLSLVCGSGLDSNPQAAIIWRAPDGTTVINNARFNLENGPEIVDQRLCSLC